MIDPYESLSFNDDFYSLVYHHSGKKILGLIFPSKYEQRRTLLIYSSEEGYESHPRFLLSLNLTVKKVELFFASKPVPG